MGGGGLGPLGGGAVTEDTEVGEVAREEVEVSLCCLRNFFGMVERQEVGGGGQLPPPVGGHWEDGEWEYCPQQTRGWSLSLQDH